MAAGNPFYDVHAAIWTRLEAIEAFTNNVHADNRIKYTADPETILNARTEAVQGVPEVVVVDAGSKVLDRRASNMDQSIRQWEIWLRGCPTDVDKYFDLCFAIYRAMLDWDNETTGLKTLTWATSGGSVPDCDLRSSDESVLNSSIARNNKGWSAKWVGITKLCFAHDKLVAIG